MVNPILLPGCTPVPLAHYLKALGILRLVGEQLPEARARGAWRNDVFVLEADLDEAALVRFFLEDYRPTPVLNPWNGDGGFFTDSRAGAVEVLAKISKSNAKRLELYRSTISKIRHVFERYSIEDKPTDDNKGEVLAILRNELADDALSWLDAVCIFTKSGPKYPPLLGSGGNDGSIDFSKNFMQRLTKVIAIEDGLPTSNSARWLRAALYDTAAANVSTSDKIGQFYPGAAGGSNSSTGFDAAPTVNPWDYVLMIEGTVLFAGASVKRLGTTDPGSLIYPFCVRQAGVGYGSATASDEGQKSSRCEMWMPLWERPTNLAEIQALLGEGRVQVGPRAASNGVDFMRAAVSLGVDRGIKSFQRYGFQARNGLSYFAIPLDRVPVRRNAKVDLLSDLEKGSWLERFRSKAASTNPEPPGSVARALRRLEDAIFGLCRSEEPSKVQGVLVALGQCEKALARSVRWTRDAYLKPLTTLSPRWLSAAYTEHVGAAEFRLAATLATTQAYYGDTWRPLRAHLEPVAGWLGKTIRLDWLKIESNDMLWHEGKIADVLNAIFARRLVRAEQAGSKILRDQTKVPVRLSDLAAFIEGGDQFDELFADLLWGCSLVDYSERFVPPWPEFAEDDTDRPPAFYALLKLALAGEVDGTKIPLQPAIHQRAAAGDARAASELAARRLRASGLAPAIDRASLDPATTRRAAATLLFPLGQGQLSALTKTVLRPSKQTTT